ncbi:hypothetical protein [Paenibacillus polymyxa]|uniref:hypothetical protein n=1 Tax=Paenibacillus polymyxa TaxID=1406 RepID=UPI002AB41050|nr:hypothetical protein [Paenibacillus polymyxa]MDY8021159.1 hypothetical protein [Paenibacillus polymyxa]
MTLDELEVLDGKVSDEAQKVIDEAKKECSYGFEMPIMNEIIKSSEKTGTLKWTHKSIRSCDYCDKEYDYHTYPRSSRNHTKGEKNYNKPIYYSGIKFNEGFVTFQGDGDMCSECCIKQKVKERLIDYIIDNDLKIQIMKNDYRVSKYLKDDIRTCYSCNEDMLESQMGKEPTMMGDGFYPSKCPHCGAESKPFGKSHGVTNRFGMIKNPAAKEEVQKTKELVDTYNQNKDKNDHLYFYQNSHTDSTFGVNEEKWTNGNTKVIQFNINSKKFTVGYFYKEKSQQFKELLTSFGYIEVEDK